jgi:hypothetical protein
MRLETNIQNAWQRFIRKHFILKVIRRKSPNPEKDDSVFAMAGHDEMV